MRPGDIELRAASFQRYFVLGLFVCSATSVIAAARASARLSIGSALNPTWSAVPWLILGLGLAVFAFWRIRFRIFWEAVFTLALFLGVWYLGLVFLSVSFGLFAASIVVLLPFIFPRVWAHDIFFFVGAIGVILNLSAQYPAELLIVVLAVTALYDIVAAPPGGVVAELASRLVAKGFVPGFIIPPDPAFLLSPLKEVRKSNASLLGAGDLILPLILVAQSAAHSLRAAFLVSLGMLCGALFLTRRPAQAPRPALPPLALGTGIPFVVLYVCSRLW